MLKGRGSTGVRRRAFSEVRRVERTGAGIGAAATVGVLAASNGGYFPTAWGWSALILLFVAVLALVLRSEIALGSLELGFLGGTAVVVAWIGLSIGWTQAVPQSVLDVERALVYLAAVVAGLFVLRRHTVSQLLGGALVAIVAISAYSLATRVFPDRLGEFDPVAGYRLSEPIGYWNALGIFGALGVLLALGFIARARSLVARALAGASVVVLLPTIYFTFSRGAWVALGIGLIVSIALDPQRLRLVTAMFFVAPAALLGVWLSSREPALTTVKASLADASEQGHRLALALAILALFGAALGLAFGLAADRARLSPGASRAYGLALLLAAVVALTAVFVRYGTPPTLAQKAYEQFRAPAPKIADDLNARLFNFSSRGRYEQWKIALQMYEDNPWLGRGAGSYEAYWHEHRPVPGKVKDAHSLYFETLAELGPVGLGLLLLALGVPVVGAVKARRHPLVPAAFGAYVAYLAHAGVDWDWEMPAVTVTALLIASAILVAGRTGGEQPLSPRGRASLLAATLAIGTFVFVGLIGNSALAASAEAVAASDWPKAESEARKASRWAPWSSQPWQLLGQAYLAQGDRRAARTAFAKAIEKDPENWELWFGLAGSSDGRAQRQAFQEAWRLNPFTRGPLTDEHEE